MSKTLYFRDDFNDTASTYLENHTPDFQVLSNTWSCAAATWAFATLSAGSYQGIQNSGSVAIARYDIVQSDFILIVDIAEEQSAEPGVVFRYQDANNYWLVEWDDTVPPNGALRLVKVEGGSETQMDIEAGTGPGGESTYIVTCDGTSISASVHGTTDATSGNPVTATSSFLEDATVVGIRGGGGEKFVRIQAEEV